MEGSKEKILISREEISERIRQVAAEISEKYRGEDVLVICLLRGGFVFCSDLVKEMTVPTEIDFMTTSSYGNATRSSGIVEILQHPRVELKDRNILIVDDIMDSGNTVSAIKNYVLTKEPKKVEIAVLLDKPERREAEVEPNYCCFKVEDVFVVGYGLDYNNFHRNKPYVFTYED